MSEGLSSRRDEPYGNGSKKFKLGGSIAGSIGYNFHSLGKLELELNERENPVKILTDTIRAHPITATEQSQAFMANAYLSPWCWNNFTPFVGAGYGYTRTQFALHTNLFPPPSFSHAYHTTYHSAYQIMGGINYALDANISLGVEYRYFKIPTIEYPRVKSRYASDDVLLNLTYLFNAPHCRRVNCYDMSAFYFATEGGIAGRENEPYSTGTKSFQNGPALGAALGYNHANYIRLEGEFIFRKNTVDIIQLGRRNRDRPTGDENIFAYMGNVYFTPLTCYRLMPYLGAGIGYADITYAVHVNLPPNPPAFAHPRLGYSNVAYQGMAGFTYQLASNFQLGIEYRNFRMGEMRYEREDGTQIRTHIYAHTGLLRLTYLFG